MSAAAIVLGTSLGILQRILGTVNLSGKQWIVCILAGFSIVVASELQKFLRRRRAGVEPKRDVPAGEAVGQVAVGPTTP